MSFLRGIIDSFSSIFTEEEEDITHRHEISKHDPTVSTSSDSMNSSVNGGSVTNERVAYKLKGYFDLAKEEIAKGVRAEEWGLHDDALLHYRNAQRIMNEATSTPSPSYITSSEKEKVRLYREKISKWQSQVSGRLQALGKRTGLLLFGPPGNGKTMLAKAVASESQATFFNVSASSLTSKWVGEAEKLVKTLFQVAISRQPSVIFMDEIDSIMSTRSISENEASRRLKSEFLIQFDGVTSNPDDLVIVIGATNKPQELDDAVLRRLVKRIYVPLPDSNVRKLLFKTKLKCQPHSLSGYSGSDLQALCEEAAMMPIRELGADILTIQANKVRPLRYDDFRKSMGVIRPSLSKSKWEELERWNSEFAGLDGAKQALMEMVILPAKRRDLFTGLRRPARGLLLFGPPGNGKTMLAKAVASESQATFFNVSASSLTSKWVGEAEKLVKTLFQVAISRQPSVIFMDEIDSIMSTRSISENEASRRLKSEFLIQFDGVTSNPDDLVIVIGATNKPQELDDAVLRRLVKRIYVPLPDSNVRKLLFKTKLKCQPHSLSGYSGSDLQALCEEAAMMPIRELGADILTIQANKVRPLMYDDFRKSMGVIRPSLSRSKWKELERWNSEFGSN
ncbi:hypothetical protein F2Q68_00028432 [Brassica cretica]|uniref:Vesicle-fusing ATPase n=1 Tax=Brassica cretica TaxID=69181 RepID=A0A8S9IBY7_BRACR|nr:hypothetical protein F2Q68_00028432 [Brassica cretica]